MFNPPRFDLVIQPTHPPHFGQIFFAPIQKQMPSQRPKTLHAFAAEGRLTAPRLHQMVRSGADVNSPDALGLTPLHHAAANGHLETLTTLVRAGAIVDAPNTQGRTALHLAAMAEKDMSNTVKSLVSHGANVEARDLYAQTPLHWACDRGHQNSIAALLEAKSDANSAGNNGDTPLGIAVTFGRSMGNSSCALGPP